VSDDDDRDDCGDKSCGMRYLPVDAGVAELADAQDLKSCDPKGSCGFDPRPRQSLTTICASDRIGHFWPIASRSSAAPIRPINLVVAIAPVGAINWKSLRSGLKWIVFSPLMFLWGAMADRTSSDLEYNIQVLLFGAWSVLGVISGIGTIAGASWAARVQSVLWWILMAFLALCVVALVAILLYEVRNFAG
jgi:hypothetical protein